MWFPSPAAVLCCATPVRAGIQLARQGGWEGQRLPADAGSLQLGTERQADGVALCVHFSS